MTAGSMADTPEPRYPGAPHLGTIKVMYVVAHDGGYEGYSLPYLAFSDLDQAIQWVKAQTEAFDIAEVPIYPELPTDQWWAVKEAWSPHTPHDKRTE